MLVLTRRPGDAVLVDNGRIRVRILSTSKHGVKIGVEAPEDCVVLREELWRTEAGNAAAAASDPAVVPRNVRPRGQPWLPPL